MTTTLKLDPRQRAMLQEMGLRVWQVPRTGPAAPGAVSGAVAAPELIAISQTSIGSEGQFDTKINVTAEAPPAVPKVPEVPEVSVQGTLQDAGRRQRGQDHASSTAPSGQVSAQAETPSAEALPAGPWSTLAWSALVQAAADCQACALCHGRKQVVFGAAPDTCRADWLVLGEPPDEDEEREGRVFVGPAGVLMDNMLRAVEARRWGLLEKENRLDEEVSAAGSLGLGRAFLTPAAKCRPAGGRKATAAELRQCEPILRQQVALVQPKIILAMGLQAAQVVLACVIPDVHRMPLGKLRGNVHRYQGVPVVVTYSPRSLLRTPMDKGKAWADLCLARQQLSSPER